MDDDIIDEINANDAYADQEVERERELAREKEKAEADGR